MSQSVIPKPAPPPTGVKVGLGLAALTAIVVGSMIGSGIFALCVDRGNSMARGQTNDLIASTEEEGIRSNEKRMCSLLGHGRKRSVYLAFGAGAQDNELQSHDASRCLNVSHLDLGSRRIWIYKNSNHLGIGSYFVQ